MTENDIPPPVSPLTKQMNLTLLRFVRGMFVSKYLPAFDFVVTSDLRTPEHNAQVGGAANSAHLHGLAEDGQLHYRANGQVVPASQAKAVYDQVIAPHWPGFTEWEPASTTATGSEGYHIHWNLSREISTYAGLVGLAGLGVVGFVIINNWGNKNG